MPSVISAFAMYGQHIGMRPVSTYDCDPSCQEHLLALCEGCVKPDLTKDVLLPEWDVRWSYEKLTKMVQAAPLTESFCLAHGKTCKPIRVDVEGPSGTPCPDWSPLTSGQEGRRYDGKSLIVPLCFCRLQTAKEVPVFVHENVPLFPLDILDSNCPDHEVGRLSVSPKHVGFPMAERERVYDWGFHEQHVVQHAEVKDCYNFVADRMGCDVEIKDCLVASHTEVWQEEFAIAKLRSREFWPKTPCDSSRNHLLYFVQLSPRRILACVLLCFSSLEISF
jgi:hypothetical protein